MMLTEESLKFDIQFSAATAGLQFSYTVYLFYDKTFFHAFAKCFILMLMISLCRIAQQSANGLQANKRFCLFYFLDCGLPDFFLIEILSFSSATFIIVSNASARSFSHSNCFCKAAIFFSRSCCVGC